MTKTLEYLSSGERLRIGTLQPREALEFRGLWSYQSV